MTASLPKRRAAAFLVIVIAIAVGLGVPSVARSQDAADQAALAALIDSVATLKTLDGVDSVPNKWNSKRPSGMNEMRRAVLDWHRGRLTKDAAYYADAVQDLQRATQRAGGWPYPWYLLATIKLEMLSQAYRVPGVTMQKGAAYRRYLEEGLRALDTAIETDSTFPPTVQYLSDNGEWVAWLRTEDVSAELKESWEDEVSLVLAEGPPAPKWRPSASAATASVPLSAAQLALGALRDSLQRLTSTAEIAAVDQRWNPTSQFFDPEWGALRLGFIELRLAELQEDSLTFWSALDVFQRAMSLNATEPYVWYGLGLGHLGIRWLATRDPQIVEPEAGYKGHYEPAMLALSRSLELNPGFLPTIELVMAMAVQEGNRVQPPWVMSVAERVTVGPVPDPNGFLVLGRHQRNTGDAMEGLTSFEQFLATGGDTGVAALELARVLSDLDYLEPARQAYLAGLTHLGPAARAAYRRDLTWVAEANELVDFDGLPPDSVGTWISWFWTKRDALSVRAEGERLREHLQRWSYMNRNFRVSSPQARAQLNPPLMVSFQPCTEGIDRMSLDDLPGDNPTRPNDLRGWEPIYDHRAAVHMRHGFPNQRVWKILGSEDSVITSLSDAPPNPQIFRRDPRLARPTPLERDNPFGMEDPSGPGGGGWRETWLYYFAGSPRIVNFQDTRALGPGPTTMVAIIPLTPNYLDALSVFGSGMGRDFSRVRHDAQSREAGMQRATVTTRCTMAGQRIQQAAADDFVVAAETDSYTLLFPDNLYPSVQVFGLPPADNSRAGTMLVAFSAPIDNLPPVRTSDSTRTVPLRLRISAVDTLTHQTVLQDTVHTFDISATPGGSDHLSGLVEVPAPDGFYDVRVAVQLADSTAGNVVEFDQPVEVWSHTSGIQLSDLVTGGGNQDALWWYGAEPVPVNPLESFARSATVEVFYIQSGLRPEESYTTTITLQRMDSENPVLSVGFDEVAGSVIETKQRGLALGDVDPGTYRLQVSIQENGTTRVVRRTRLIRVAG